MRHDPITALDGGRDGLDFYRKLAGAAADHLKEGGFLAAEFGIHQADAVVNLLKKTGKFDSFEVITDYGGIERAVYCRKKAEE